MSFWLFRIVQKPELCSAVVGCCMLFCMASLILYFSEVSLSGSLVCMESTEWREEATKTCGDTLWSVLTEFTMGSSRGFPIFCGEEDRLPFSAISVRFTNFPTVILFFEELKSRLRVFQVPYQLGKASPFRTCRNGCDSEANFSFSSSFSDSQSLVGGEMLVTNGL